MGLDENKLYDRWYFATLEDLHRPREGPKAGGGKIEISDSSALEVRQATGTVC